MAQDVHLEEVAAACLCDTLQRPCLATCAVTHVHGAGCVSLLLRRTSQHGPSPRMVSHAVGGRNP